MLYFLNQVAASGDGDVAGSNMERGMNMGKKLVAYFSASGVTKAAAEKLAKVAGADLYEIKPAVPYTEPDLDWMNPDSRSSVEMKDTKSRPELAEKDADFSGYDTFFLGFPIWWYVAPRIINTFLETYNFSGKTIVLFATSGGSGFGRTLEELESSVSGSARVMEGGMLNGLQSVEEVAELVRRLGL